MNKPSIEKQIEVLLKIKEYKAFEEERPILDDIIENLVAIRLWNLGQAARALNLQHFLP